MQFLAFLIAARKNKYHFWNPETTLVKKDMILQDFFFNFGNLTYFDLILTFPRIMPKSEYHNHILWPKWPTKHVSQGTHDITLRLSFGTQGSKIWRVYVPAKGAASQNRTQSICKKISPRWEMLQMAAHCTMMDQPRTRYRPGLTLFGTAG